MFVNKKIFKFYILYLSKLKYIFCLDEICELSTNSKLENSDINKIELDTSHERLDNPSNSIVNEKSKLDISLKEKQSDHSNDIVNEKSKLDISLKERQSDHSNDIVNEKSKLDISLKERQSDHSNDIVNETPSDMSLKEKQSDHSNDIVNEKSKFDMSLKERQSDHSNDIVNEKSKFDMSLKERQSDHSNDIVNETPSDMSLYNEYHELLKDNPYSRVYYNKIIFPTSESFSSSIFKDLFLDEESNLDENEIIERTNNDNDDNNDNLISFKLFITVILIYILGFIICYKLYF